MWKSRFMTWKLYRKWLRNDLLMIHTVTSHGVEVQAFEMSCPRKWSRGRHLQIEGKRRRHPIITDSRIMLGIPETEIAAIEIWVYYRHQNKKIWTSAWNTEEQTTQRQGATLFCLRDENRLRFSLHYPQWPERVDNH